ncbi:Protein YIPF, partial [Fasciolopsis buskii]
VLRRLVYALIPNPRISFVQHALRPHADLYGPFWIATTLILTAAIGGNVFSYLHSHGQVTSWKYDFRKVTLASTIIYVYWWLIPLGLTAFAYMRSKRAQQGNDNEDRTNLLESNRSLSAPTHKFVDLLSVYGYSLAVFVPVSILWAIPNSIFQWFLVVVAMAISSSFLAFALFPLFRKDYAKVSPSVQVYAAIGRPVTGRHSHLALSVLHWTDGEFLSCANHFISTLVV